MLSIEARRKLNYTTAGPLGNLASGAHTCQRCGCPCRDEEDRERHRKAYHGKNVKHGISYNGITGTWKVTHEGETTYLLSEDEAWEHWRSESGQGDQPAFSSKPRRGLEGIRY